MVSAVVGIFFISMFPLGSAEAHAVMMQLTTYK